MDLSDSELYWTRKQKGLATEKETEEYIRNLEKRAYNLEEIEKEHKKQNGELQKKIKELEEYIENKVIAKEYVDKNYISKEYVDKNYISKDYVDKNYISKDYIKKKIKILKKLYKEAGEPAEYNTKSTYLYHKIINYKELLEDK